MGDIQNSRTLTWLLVPLFSLAVFWVKAMLNDPSLTLRPIVSVFPEVRRFSFQISQYMAAFICTSGTKFPSTLCRKTAPKSDAHISMCECVASLVSVIVSSVSRLSKCQTSTLVSSEQSTSSQALSCRCWLIDLEMGIQKGVLAFTAWFQSIKVRWVTNCYCVWLKS